MSQENTPEARKPSLLPPVLLCLLLSLLLVGLSFYIWRSYQEKLAAEQAASAGATELIQEKNRLEGLLRLPPCEAKAQFP